MVNHVTKPALITVWLDVKFLAQSLGGGYHFPQYAVKRFMRHVRRLLKSQMNMRMVSVWPIAQKGHRCDPEAFALCSVLVDAPIDAVEE